MKNLNEYIHTKQPQNKNSSFMRLININNDKIIMSAIIILNCHFTEMVSTE